MFLLNNDVWISTNALDWEKRTGEILPGQQVFGYTVEVMDDKFLLMGCNRNGLFSSQVLNSDDSISLGRAYCALVAKRCIVSVVYHGKIFITGGKYGGLPNAPDFRYSNDVWVLSSHH